MTTLVMNRIKFESFEFLYTKPNSESHYAGWGRSYKFGHFPMASDLMLYQYWYPVWYKKNISGMVLVSLLLQISVSVSVSV